MNRSLVHEKSAPIGAGSLAVLAKGFRPFFLLAALHAVITLPLWVASLRGHVAVGGSLGATVWHAHEMLFGFTAAVIAGFLLTAAANWTSRETATGAPLAGLVVLWLVGRFLAFAGIGWGAYVDGAFFLGLALALARPIVLSKSRRNYLFPVMILGLGAGDIWLHSGAAGHTLPGLRLGPLRALDVVVVMMVLVTGRIVPMFTRNALQDKAVKNSPALDRLALGSVLALAVLGAAQVPERWLAAIALLAGVLVFARAHAWGAQRTLRNPLLWILHAGHAFIALGLLLRAGSHFLGSFPTAMWTHCLTAGAIGSLTLGMMSRVTLGHTGRMLAAPRAVAWGFGATVAGATLRVLAPLTQGAQVSLLTVAGILWMFGFATFLLFQSRMLVTQRVDGRPG